MAKLTIVFFSPQPASETPKLVRPSGTVTLVCIGCSCSFKKKIGAYNYQINKGIDRFFCSRYCFYESRKGHKSEEQKKAEKAAYDLIYKEKNIETIRVRRHNYFKRTYDPAKAAIHRKGRMKEHAEYCRRPAYRAWKAEYDKQYHAKKNYGEYWECHLLASQIQAEYDDKAVRQANELHNKSIKRKRLWHSHKNSLQVL